jgi:hypothetical protein
MILRPDELREAFLGGAPDVAAGLLFEDSDGILHVLKRLGRGSWV